MIRPDLDPQLAESIKSLLLELDKTPEGQEILMKFAKTAKFDQFPTEETVDRMREMYQKAQNP